MTAHILTPDSTQRQIQAAFEGPDTRNIIFEPGDYTGAQWTGLHIRPGLALRGRRARFFRDVARPFFSVALDGSAPIRIEGFDFVSEASADQAPAIRVARSPTDLPSKARPRVSISDCRFRLALGVEAHGVAGSELHLTRFADEKFPGTLARLSGDGRFVLRELTSHRAAIELNFADDARSDVLMDTVQVARLTLRAADACRLLAHGVTADRLTVDGGAAADLTFTTSTFRGTALDAPGQCTFIDCHFDAASTPDPLVIIDWKERECQRVRFMKCRFEAHAPCPVALRCEADRPEYDNRLEVVGSLIKGRFDIGVELDRGGRVQLSEVEIKARTAVQLTGSHNKPNHDGAKRRPFYALLEAVDAPTAKVQLNLIGGTRPPYRNGVRHLGGSTPARSNVLLFNGPLMLPRSVFEGGRLLVHDASAPRPLQPSAPGMLGDVFAIVTPGRPTTAWVCTRTDFTRADWEPINH